MKKADMERAYRLAREQYAEYGVDTDAALRRLAAVRLSLHCWQGDDVGGFERSGGLSDGGIQATGNYPGKARTADELRRDLDQALVLIPGRHRLNLHAIYAETAGRRVERTNLTVEHFANWIGWAKRRKLGLDFNGTFFSHPKAASGLTLSHPDAGIRRFWVQHGIACRAIGEQMGRALGTPCVTNLWIPDGYKDIPADRLAPRTRLKDALDRIFARKANPRYLLDAVESKLFGIGSESYVVGSHEFYLGYALKRNLLLCLDTGHFHPTETIADKISATLLYLDQILIHVSRGVRWDSDHVVILSDELRAIMQEVVRADALARVHIALDFFDASINRIAAWVIGTRATQQALLAALLEPADMIRGAESAGDFTARLALMEAAKTLPLGAVWDYHCLRQGVPPAGAWLADVKKCERTVLATRCR